MKGNKFEQSVLTMSNEMGGIDSKCADWLLSNITPTAYVNKNNVICMECGHEFTSETCSIDGTIECPVCHKKLKIEWTRKKVYDESKFLAITHEYSGFQVVRYFWVNKWRNRQSGKGEHFISEVMQIWFNETGKKVYLSKPLKMYPNEARNPFREVVYNNKTEKYEDAKMSIRRPGTGCGFYGFNIAELGYKKLKIVSLAQFLKHRGVKRSVGSFPYNYQFDDFIDMIMAPLAEVIHKKGQKELLFNLAHGKFWKQDGNLSKRLQALKIALRHSYFDNHKLYEKQDPRYGHENDRVLYSDWMDLINQIIRMGLDYSSPKYVCPEDLHGLHNALIRKENRTRQEADKLAKLEKDRSLNEQYINARDAFFSLNLVDKENGFSIQVLKSVEDFYEEANKMHHCVFNNGYYDMSIHPNSLIMSARTGDDWNNPDKRLETIEVNLENFTVVQSKAVHNGTDKLHNKILSLVLKNMDVIQNIYERRKVFKAA